MCGIAGSWSRNGVPADGERLRAGLDAIRHRGPDDLGEFAWHDTASPARVDLGLARLAILDLSQAGHQPMTLPGGRLTITFNGEITNYVEIREKLRGHGETFASDSDTEVLLKAWARWGIATLDRLEGMYAFAILDTVARTLTMARDPYGIKPLFYTQDREHLEFNSELRGLIAAAIPHPRLDWQAAVDYLQWGLVDNTERSFVDGVSQLAPGHYVVLDVDTGMFTEPVRYWWPSVEASFHGGYREATEIVRSLFLDSVRRNLRSDVPVGIALSGGIDSSAIVGAVRYLEPDLPIQTFSYIAPGFTQSEHEWIATVARELGATSHTVETDASDLERDLDDLILSEGEPFGSTSIYAQYRVFRLARERGVVVTLDGQGGDEQFAGYSGYPAPRMRSMVETGHWVAAARFVSAWGEWPGRDRPTMLIEAAGQFAPQNVRGRILRRPPSPLFDLARLADRGVDARFPLSQNEPIRGRRVASQLRTALTRVGLPALLRNGDRNSMRFSIESRVPFLDRALTEFVLGLPEEWLIGPDGTSKRILRDAVRGLIPDAIVARRDKVGFATPQSSWLDRLATQPADPDHPIGFLKAAHDGSFTGGLSEAELRWGSGSHWRLINLRRWIALTGIDAS
jgi:asparagine synthase (glutamine-hydrolysing)